MTVKLIALYKKPDDEAAFLRHYHDVHMPLVLKTPHLVKTEINRVIGAHSASLTISSSPRCTSRIASASTKPWCRQRTEPPAGIL